MAKNRRKAKSPYQKHNKRPHRYSQLFYDWFAAVKSGNTSLADDLGRRHSAGWTGKQR